MATMIIGRIEKQLRKQHGQRKHYCHICKKRFSCRRALGEHMGAHGITGEPISNPDEDQTTTAGKHISNSRSIPTHKRTSHICGNCSKTLRSLKSFHEHSRWCSVIGIRGEEDDLNGLSRPSSPRSYYNVKRTSRDRKPDDSTPPPPHLVTKEEDVANCLVMLSATSVEPVLLIADREECFASVNMEVDDEIPTIPQPQPKPQVPTLTTPRSCGIFECKDCKKIFDSHQALGGHRASHNKVKGCFAAHLEVEEPGTENALMEDANNNTIHKNNEVGSSLKNMTLSITPFAKNSPQSMPKKESKPHICSICEQQFASGQALGGHKRSHRITSKTVVTSSSDVEPTSDMQVECSSNGDYLMQTQTQNLLQILNSSDHQPLDLNLPAPMDDLIELSLQLDMPALIYLQPGGDVQKTDMNKYIATCNNDMEEEKTSNQNLDDEAESKEVKLATHWDFEDMKAGEERSAWLQIGPDPWLTNGVILIDHNLVISFFRVVYIN